MEELKILKDRAEVMSVLLQNASSYHNYINNILKYPVLLTTTGLLIINTYFKDNDENIKIPNIVLNGTNMILLGIITNLDLNKKIENLKIKSLDFLELSHEIDAKILLGNITNEDVINKQIKYDEIYKNVLIDSIPEYIKIRVHNKFKNKKNMPIICNGLLGLDDNLC